MPLDGLQLGRFRFIRLLGSGGMGEVYLAEDPRIQQRVAIKVIRSEVSPYPDEQAVQEVSRLFEREAIAVAKLDHPHILPLYDYGEAVVNGTRLTYLVMPYRPEGSLLDWLRRRGSADLLPPAEVASIVVQTAEALQHAHDRKIIHQDVKPSNLLIRERREEPDHPDILLSDFGIAKSAAATSSVSQVIRGTPTYMAPEQWAAQPVFATDQYALAVMAFELLTGRPPFQGGSVQMMYQHLHAQPPLLSSMNWNFSQDADAVFLHGLAKKPQARFASVRAFAEALYSAVQKIDFSAFEEPSKVQAVTSKPISPPVVSRDEREFPVTLTISPTEARTGVSRNITIAGGQQVSAFIPAGVQNGQVIRYEGLKESLTGTELPGVLILTLAIQQTAETHTQSRNSHADVGKPVVFDATLAHTTVSYLAQNQTYNKHRFPSKGRTVLLVVLALMIVIGSLGLFSIVRSNQMATDNTNATATASVSGINSTISGSATPSTVVYPNIMGNYSGTIHNNRTNQPTTTMQLTINQNQDSITGYFTVALPLQGSGPFAGSIDTNNMILFIVDTSADNLNPQANIKFYNGTVHQDGSLSGDYCSVNPNKDCDTQYGGFGTWSVERL